MAMEAAPSYSGGTGIVGGAGVPAGSGLSGAGAGAGAGASTTGRAAAEVLEAAQQCRYICGREYAGARMP